MVSDDVHSPGDGMLPAGMDGSQSPVRPIVYDGITMKGFVPTPSETVDGMVELLFCGRPPGRTTGCSTPDAAPAPSSRGSCVGAIGTVSSPTHNRRRVRSAARGCLRGRFDGDPAVEIVSADFLLNQPGTYDFIIGTPICGHHGFVGG